MDMGNQIGNSNVYEQLTLLKLRKHILKYTLNKYHVHRLSSFKHLKLPTSMKISVTIWHIVYIYMTAIPLNLISGTMLLLRGYSLEFMKILCISLKIECVLVKSTDPDINAS